MTLLGEQGRGDRGVDASTHGYDNAHRFLYHEGIRNHEDREEK
jgi:hypothetical protein